MAGATIHPLVDLQHAVAKAGKSAGNLETLLALPWWGENGKGSPEENLGEEACRWLGIDGLEPCMEQLQRLIVIGDHKLPSLKALSEASTGRTLDKRKQTSDWGARPLEEAQVRYAALDALVLARIYLALARATPALAT